MALTASQQLLLLAFGSSSSTLLTSDEVPFLISAEHNVYMASAAACELLAGKGGAVHSKTVGSLTITYAATDELRKRAAYLRARGGAHQVLTAGGVYESDRDTIEDDSDIIQPAFERGIHDNPGTKRLDPEWEAS